MAKATKDTKSVVKEKAPVFFNTDSEILDKLKTVASTNGWNNTDVYNLAFEKFIELYEAKNGKIKPGVKKKDIKL
jgi:hypothetical protein